MPKKPVILLIIVAFLFICIGIGTLSVFRLFNLLGNKENMPSQANCPTLPEAFQISDLIGTWKAKYSDGATDMLIIQKDGKYKQVYSSPNSKLNFESNLLDWDVEKRQSGFIRLHMKSMHRCDDLDAVCTRQGGGVDPNELRSIDYCEGQVIEMPNEVVLVVTGVSKNNSIVPRGIWLRHTRLAGTDWSYTFELQEDK